MQITPVELRLPSLGIGARVLPIGVERGGELEIPEDVRTVGWYRFGPGPGDRQGSVVMSGHIDSAEQGKGSFFRLRELRPGNTVLVRMSSGRSWRYRVVAREVWPKTVVPLDRIFSRSGAPAADAGHLWRGLPRRRRVLPGQHRGDRGPGGDVVTPLDRLDADDELALAERFRHGDETVLREVYDRYGGLVYRLGVSCLSRHHEAEDVTQSTFVAAWRGRQTYDPDRGSLAGWLLGIARRQVLDRLRVIDRERSVTAAMRQAGPGHAEAPAPSGWSTGSSSWTSCVACRPSSGGWSSWPSSTT